MRYAYLADAGLTEAGQPRQQLVAGQAVAFSWSVKVFQVSGAKASWGPSGWLLSRLKQRISRLVSVAVALGENAVREALVDPCRVLGHLGLDLVLQVNAGHLGEA